MVTSVWTYVYIRSALLFLASTHAAQPSSLSGVRRSKNGSSISFIPIALFSAGRLRENTDMVAVSQRRRTRHKLRGGSGGFMEEILGSEARAVLVAACGLCSVVFFLWTGGPSSSSPSSLSIFRRSSSNSRAMLDPIRPNLHLDFLGDNAESMNAVAQEIIETLDCHNLLNRTSDGYGWGGYYADSKKNERDAEPRRLLEAVGEGGPVDDRRAFIERDADPAKKKEVDPLSDRSGGGYQQGRSWDDTYPGASRGTSITPTAAHLFCVSALWASTTDPQDHVTYWKDQIKCPATSSRPLTLELIELWSTARSEMPRDLLLTTLKATEKSRDLVGSKMYLWAPPLDDGIEYMLGVVNKEGGEWRSMHRNLGRGKLFVDVGSYLGVAGMAVAMLYPGTQVVSVEAAAPNWLLQQVNWRCNHHAVFPTATAGATNTAQSSSSLELPTVLLSGVGPAGHASHVAMMMWRPTATTATRSWTPAKELKSTDVEISVHLKAWHSLLQEAGIVGRKINVLNVDCEGCEYNLIPAMSDEEFRSVETIMGTVHWGYIPFSKLPSSKRGRETHRRMCQHEAVAKGVKECCAFPDLPVKSSIPGEALVLADEDTSTGEGGGGGGGRKRERFPPKEVTVRDVAGALCNDFEEWKVAHHLDDIESDWGWFKITSSAKDA